MLFSNLRQKFDRFLIVIIATSFLVSSIGLVSTVHADGTSLLAGIHSTVFSTPDIIRSNYQALLKPRPELASDNQPPNQPVLVQPTDAGTEISLAPTLEVTVSDPDETDTLDIEFYGREVNGSAVGPNFTLVVLPDTQLESQYAPIMFNSQVEWIVAHQGSENIVFVTHVGDIVQTATDNTQWLNADAAMDLLDPPGIPYSISPGNHDMGAGSLYESYFGISRFYPGKPWYQGYYGSNNYNNFSFFSASGMDFVMINLQYNPTIDQINSADAVLKAYPARRGILVQHDILNTNDSWLNQTSYNELRDNPNLFLMLCGHMYTATDGAAYVAGTGTDGHTIHVVMQDYQEMNLGNGWLRIYRFSPADDMIYMTTYSPFTGESITTNPDQKNLVYEMGGGSPPFTRIGSQTGVSNGSNTSISWSGLMGDTEYEWYTIIKDGSTNTTSNIWSFTTQKTPTFGDVPFDHPHWAYIQALYDNGLTAGCSVDPLLYCPEANLTRTEAAVFMLRGKLGLNYEPPSDQAGFVFGNDDWSSPTISWGRTWAEGLWDEGMTAGCSADPLMFCPTSVLSRAEGAVFGLRIKHGSDYVLPDVIHMFDPAEWEPSAVSWGEAWAEQAYLEGLLMSCGTDPLRFCPEMLMTRSWAAYLIVNAKGLSLPTP